MSGTVLRMAQASDISQVHVADPTSTSYRTFLFVALVVG
jgi:hypothetical protein